MLYTYLLNSLDFEKKKCDNVNINKRIGIDMGNATKYGFMNKDQSRYIKIDGSKNIICDTNNLSNNKMIRESQVMPSNLAEDIKNTENQVNNFFYP